jgi:bis(5'-nucleosidyl)-tetraphosphatase
MGRRVFQKSCGVVPVHVTPDGDVRFLLLHSGQVRNPKATWEFPKGGVEPGESEEETALRECMEETGLTQVSLVPGYRAIDVYVFHREGSRIKKWVIYFLAVVGDPTGMKPEPDGREHVLDAQGRWFQWLSYEETRRTLYHGGQRRVLASAQAHFNVLGLGRPQAAGKGRDGVPEPAAADARPQEAGGTRRGEQDGAGAARGEPGAVAAFDGAAGGALDG